jgi:hypothetical protein
MDHMAAENAVFPWFSHIFSMFFYNFHGFPIFPWFSHGFPGHRDAEVSIPERSIALWHHWRSIFGGNAL